MHFQVKVSQLPPKERDLRKSAINFVKVIAAYDLFILLIVLLFRISLIFLPKAFSAAKFFCPRTILKSLSQ